jgi:hypothetical protein
LASASVFVLMKSRARRLGERNELVVEAGRRVGTVFAVFVGLCIASEIVPLEAGATRVVSIFWLLSIVPVAYAGLWLIMGVAACMWLFGWRPHPRADPAA